jgi:hypothetical protein
MRLNVGGSFKACATRVPAYARVSQSYTSSRSFSITWSHAVVFRFHIRFGILISRRPKIPEDEEEEEEEDEDEEVEESCRLAEGVVGTGELPLADEYPGVLPPLTELTLLGTVGNRVSVGTPYKSFE